MTTRKFFALSLAAALLSAPFAISAQAASQGRHTTPRHHTVKPTRSSSRAATPARSAASSDNSADALNAQSLARSRGGQ